jgi:hypothetical protein
MDKKKLAFIEKKVSAASLLLEEAAAAAKELIGKHGEFGYMYEEIDELSYEVYSRSVDLKQLLEYD